MKKVVSLLLVFLLLIGCFSMSVNALTQSGVVYEGGIVTKQLYGAGSTYHKQDAENILNLYISDVDAFFNKILSGISQCNKYVDISSYNLPVSTINYIANYIFYAMPEAFNTGDFRYYYNGYDRLTKLEFTYRSFADTATEYSQCYNEMLAGAEYLLQGVKGNTRLTTEQKLLILHDRMVLWNTYDNDRLAYEDPIIFTAYGSLGQASSVCQGIAMGYMFLLNQIGIENYYCSSEDLYHGWNIVFVNGKKYHVDITWDDPDYIGEVRHNNFLRSSNGMYQTGHEASDYDTTPTDTKYDNYFWQDSYAEFQLLNNELYYIDHATEELKRYSDKRALENVPYNLSTLTNDGRSLYYSLEHAIYRFDLTTNSSELIYSFGTNETLWGFEYYFGAFYCQVYYPNTNTAQIIKIPFTYDYGKYSEYGDVNDDGAINNEDYALLMQNINGWNVSINTATADVNGDKKINNEDYALVMQYINGWNVTLG